MSLKSVGLKYTVHNLVRLLLVEKDIYIFRYGFNKKGYNMMGEKRTLDNGYAFSLLRFDESGLDWQGKCFL